MPCKITPESGPAHIHHDLEKLLQTEPTMEAVIVYKSTYSLRAGLPLEHKVHVSAGPNTAATVLATSRVTAGKLEDDLIITSEHGELSDEIGLRRVDLDGIIYEAVDPIVDQQV